MQDIRISSVGSPISLLLNSQVSEMWNSRYLNSKIYVVWAFQCYPIVHRMWPWLTDVFHNWDKWKNTGSYIYRDNLSGHHKRQRPKDQVLHYSRKMESSVLSESENDGGVAVLSALLCLFMKRRTGAFTMKHECVLFANCIPLIVYSRDRWWVKP